MPARVATQPPWLSVVCRSNSSSMPCRHTGRRLLPVTKRHGPVLPLEENLLSPENIAKEISRRKALAILAVAGAGAMLGCGGGTKATATTTSTATGSSTSCTVTPEGEEGPYFVDDSATGFNRSDIRSNLDGSNTQSGIPLTLSIYVYDSEKSCAAMAGVQIDIWHCNGSGIYSAEDVESTSGETWLRGYQLTDSNGLATFVTIFRVGTRGARLTSTCGCARPTTQPPREGRTQPSYSFRKPQSTRSIPPSVLTARKAQTRPRMRPITCTRTRSTARTFSR